MSRLLMPVGLYTHAVQAPGVLQLVAAPETRDGLGLCGEVRLEFLGYGLGGEQSPVQVECDDFCHIGSGWMVMLKTRGIRY